MQGSINSVLSGDFNKKKFLMCVVTAILTVIVWNLPSSFFGIEGLTVVQQRVIAIFVMAVLLWITEAIPAWATSITIIFVLLFCVSDSSFQFFQGTEDQYGTMLDHVGVMACFADPTIILFLGGFVLAIAATKSGLDVLAARTLMKPFGQKSENVLLGFLLITGVFSMFISNTATAAMMLTFLTPVFKALPANGKGRIALTMAIPVGANLGGMGTPIGTPPNVFALKYLNDPTGLNIGITFSHWMMIMVPLVIVLLIIAWRMIIRFFPFTQKTIQLDIKGEVSHNLFGINANTVAMLPIAVFAITRVITAKDLQDIDWSVIWMVAGGFALGNAMNGTGLAENAIKSIPFGAWNPLIILFIACIICFILSNFISNTATAALLVPILAVVCKGMGENLGMIGGTVTILVGIAVAASAAMSLPISTPPNAIAFSTGLIKQNDMLKVGVSVGVITLIIGISMLIVIGKLGLF